MKTLQHNPALISARYIYKKNCPAKPEYKKSLGYNESVSENIGKRNELSTEVLQSLKGQIRKVNTRNTEKSAKVFSGNGKDIANGKEIDGMGDGQNIRILGHKTINGQTYLKVGYNLKSNGEHVGEGYMHPHILHTPHTKPKKTNQPKKQVEQKYHKAETIRLGRHHVVEKGQTLSHIAELYQVPVQKIIDANRITNPNKIAIGQKLIIPEITSNPSISPKQDIPNITKRCVDCAKKKDIEGLNTMFEDLHTAMRNIQKTTFDLQAIDKLVPLLQKTFDDIQKHVPTGKEVIEHFNHTFGIDIKLLTDPEKPKKEPSNPSGTQKPNQKPATPSQPKEKPKEPVTFLEKSIAFFTGIAATVSAWFKDNFGKKEAAAPKKQSSQTKPSNGFAPPNNTSPNKPQHSSGLTPPSKNTPKNKQKTNPNSGFPQKTSPNKLTPKQNLKLQNAQKKEALIKTAESIDAKYENENINIQVDKNQTDHSKLVIGQAGNNQKTAINLNPKTNEWEINGIQVDTIEQGILMANAFNNAKEWFKNAPRKYGDFQLDSSIVGNDRIDFDVTDLHPGNATNIGIHMPFWDKTVIDTNEMKVYTEANIRSKSIIQLIKTIQ